MKQRYDSYKPSGIEWIGEIPSHWEIIKTSLIFEGIGSGTTPSTSNKEYYTENGDGYNWLQTGDLNDGTITETAKLITKQAIKDCNLKFYPKGSLVIAMYGATIGKIGLLDIETATNQACCVLPKSKIATTSFAKYAYLSAKERLLLEASGGGQPNISQDIIRRCRIALPPLPEQEAIAVYLDKKCGEIDRVLEKQRHRIELLEELKQSILEKAFDIDAPRLKMRFIFEMRNGYTPSKSNPAFWTNGTLPWFRMEDIRTNGRILSDAIQHITPEAVKGGGLFSAGSFILATTATIGEHALLIADSLANQQFTNLKIRKSLSASLDKMYMFYYMYIIDAWCKTSIKSTTFAQVDTNDLKNQTVPLPSLDEQKKIVARIDNDWKKIDAQIAKVNREIELLEEYKQAVITEAVTGKRKVG